MLQQYVPTFNRWAPFIARLLLAGSFLFSAMGKIPGSAMFKMEVDMSATAGLPFASLMVTLAFILEVVCGVMLIIGFRARLAAFLLAGFTALIALTFVRNVHDQQQLMILFSCMNLIAGLFYISVYGARHIALRPDVN